MKFFKKNFYKTLIASIFLFSISISRLHAEDPVSGIKNPIAPIDSIDGLIATILNGVISIGLPVIALALVYCGFLFVAARGNSEKLTKAKDALIYTVIGGGILLGAWAIAKMISATVTGLG